MPKLTRSSAGLSALCLAAMLAGCGGTGNSSDLLGSQFCTDGSGCAGQLFTPSPTPSSAPASNVVGHWVGTIGGTNLDVTFAPSVTSGSDISGTYSQTGIFSTSVIKGGITNANFLDISVYDLNNTAGGNNDNVYYRYAGTLTLQSNGHLTGSLNQESGQIVPPTMLSGNAGTAIDLAPAITSAAAAH